jgi:hypothetical protein
MQLIKKYIRENYSILFQHEPNNILTAIFDHKGFSFTEEAQYHYNLIKNQPHIYVAWTNDENGYYYVGKSFQLGGRWRRQHAYHLGTLAYHLHNTIRNDDQNHLHWIECWMNRETVTNINNNIFSITLKNEVYISFIPFGIYSNQDIFTLTKTEIKRINTNIEKRLIQSFRDDNLILLNVKHN